MEELVKRNEKGQAITSSLLVAQKFEKNHRDVLDSIRELLRTAENSALLSMFVESTYLTVQNKEMPMFIMNRDGFNLLTMGFTGAKALSFKLEFIGAFNKMESMLTSDEYILMRSRQILEEKVSLLEARTEAQTKLIQEIAPKADYYDNTLASKDTVTTTQIAKELGMSGVALNKKLKELGVQYKVGEQWVLYAKYQDKGYTKPSTYTEIINGESRTYMSTVWTQKGREFIHLIINQNGGQLKTA